MKTLLVAARPRTRRLLSEALKRRKHEVTVVESADAACTALQSGDYRLVILETDGLDGKAVVPCCRLRAISRDGDCMILAAGESRQPEDVRTLLAAGADDYLTDLDDAEQLDIRLSVAEHWADGRGRCRPGKELAGQLLIGHCPVLHDAPCGVFRAGIDGRFLDVNPALVTMLGYDSEEELLGVDVPRDVHLDPAEWRQAIAQLTDRDHLEGVALGWKRKDGTPLTVLQSGRAVRDDTGAVVQIEGMVYDVSEQKRAEEALRESEQRFRAVFDHAVDGMALADAETRQLHLGNQALCQMLGYGPEELGNLTVDDLHLEENLPYVIQHFEEQVRREHSLAKDIPMKRKDGSVFYADISSFPITSAGKVQLAGIFRDVTERRDAEQALADQLQRNRLILDTSMDGFYVLDLEGRFLDTNPSTCAILGYTRAELLSMNVRDIEALESPEETGRHIERVRQSGLQRFETKHRRKNGKLLDVEISVHHRSFHGDEFLFAFVRDITERKQAENALRESDARYRLIADNVSDMIWIGKFPGLADFANRAEDEDLRRVAEESMRQWQFTYFSPSVERLLGYDVDQAVSLKFEDLLPPDSYAHAMGVLIEELATERQRPGQRRERTLEVKHRAKDGSIRWVEVTCTFWRDQERRPVGLLGVTRDVTQRKQADRALQQSESRFRTLLLAIPDIVVLIDRKGFVQYANRPGPEATMEKLIGSNVSQFVVPEHREKYDACQQQAFATGEAQAIEVMSGSGRWWSARLVPIVEDGTVRNLLIICTDITEQKKNAEALQKEQELLRHLLDLQEGDRQLVAYEIHDGFSQYLTGALYNLQGFRELQAKKPLDAWKTFDEGLTLIHRSINEARRLIAGLRPPILDESGIVAAVEYLACEAQEDTEAPIEFIHDVKFERLAPPLESAMFRIVQESLTNARRHSQSAKIRIELVQEDDRVRIGVRDWGIGFNPERVEEGRFGLRGIRERARLFGGQVTIETAPQQGTQISVELPLIETAREVSEP